MATDSRAERKTDSDREEEEDVVGEQRKGVAAAPVRAGERPTGPLQPRHALCWPFLRVSGGCLQPFLCVYGVSGVN